MPELDIKTNIVFDYLERSDKKITVMQGGSRCFAPNQAVVTDRGNIPISELKVGDKVLSHNFLKGNVEHKKVLNIIPTNNTKKTVRINMKDGTEIICTSDHKFYYKGKWVPIINILNNIV